METENKLNHRVPLQRRIYVSAMCHALPVRLTRFRFETDWQSSSPSHQVVSYRHIGSITPGLNQFYRFSWGI